MGRELGRISGPLLADNLIRNGSNLAFDDLLLYLNVNTAQIAVNNNAPNYELDISGDTATTNIIVGTQANLANLEFYTNNIQNVIGNITFAPGSTTIVPRLQATNLLFATNIISATNANGGINIGLTSATTAQIKLNNNTVVNGTLHATGNITFDGNMTFGDQATDTVTFVAEVASNVLPSANNTYTLGNNTTPLKWATTYANTVTATATNTANLTTGSFTGSGTNGLNGNVIIGTNGSNTLTVTARITTSLIPNVTNTYNLGSTTGPLYWNNVYGVIFNNSNITVTSNTIQTNTTNSSLRLVANGTGQVVFSKLNVTNNATVGGTLGVTGTSTLTNTTTGAITEVGNISQTGNFVTTGSISSGSITAANPLTLPTFTLNGSVITGTANNNLVLTANTGQKVQITSDALFDINATVGGTLTVSSTSTLTNTSTGAITEVGNISQTGNFVTTGTISSGSITAANPLTLPTFTLNGSVITGTANNNLILTPNTGQKVQITSGALFDINATVGGTLTVSSTSTLTNTTVGNIALTGDYNQTGNAILGTVGSSNITASGPLTLPSVILSGTNSTTNASAIVGINTNANLIFTPYAGKIVEITSNTQIDSNLTVAGTLNVTGASSLANTTSNITNLVGNLNQTGNSVLGAINSGSIDIGVGPFIGDFNNKLISQLGTLFIGQDDETLLYVNPLAVPQIPNPLTLPTVVFNGSTITGTANNNLVLTAKSGQLVKIPSPTQFDNDVSIAGTLTVTGAISLATTAINGTVTQTGDYNQTGNFTTSGNVSTNSFAFTGVTDTFNLDEFVIGGNTITVRAQGLKTNAFKQLISQNSSLFTGIDDETLIYINPRGSDMTFLANGTGSVYLSNYLKIYGNSLINQIADASVPLLSEIGVRFASETGEEFYAESGVPSKVQDSIYFTPTGTGNVFVSSSRSLILPISNDTISVLDTLGEIRFNDNNLNIEGYISPGYVNFINLYSKDHQTYITPELTPGTADNTLRFAVGGTVTTTLTSTTLTNNNLTVNNAININGNVISNTNTSNNVILYSSGTKKTNFNGFNYVLDNTINTPSSGALTISPTDAGYVRFAGTNGIGLPLGTNSNYPASPVIGTMRYNTTVPRAEVFNGTVWIPADGVTTTVYETDVADITLVYELILGF